MAAGALGLLAVGAFKAVKAASALEEAQNASAEVFKSSAGEVEKWSKSTKDAFSQTDFLGAAKGFAVFARTAGLADRETALFSKTLLDASGDLASFHDANPADVLADMKSGLAGETEPLRKYGILINEAALQQEAWRRGIAKAGQPLNERQKVLARHALILGQVGAANGDWARTLGSAANQERLAAANSADHAASLGQGLLPAYKMLLGVGIAFIAFLGQHQGLTKVLVAVIASLAAIVLVTAAGLKLYATAQTIANVATKITNASLRVQRILLATSIVGALVLLVAAIVLAWRKWETFRNVVKGVLDTVVGATKAAVAFIKEHWRKLIVFLLGPLGLAIVAVVEYWDDIKRVGKAAFGAVRDSVGWVIDKVETLIGWIRTLIGWINSIPDLPGGGRAPGQSFRPGGVAGPTFRGASGGIVTRPTLSLIGEGGPEAVVPLSRAPGARSLGGLGEVRVIVVGGDREAIEYLRRLDRSSSRDNGGQGIL